RPVASGCDASATLARIRRRHKHDVAADRAKEFQRQCNWTRNLHLVVARYVHCGRAPPILAGVPARADHSLRHSGPCLGRNLGVVFAADRGSRYRIRSRGLVALARAACAIAAPLLLTDPATTLPARRSRGTVQALS